MRNLLLCGALVLGACGGSDTVSSDEQARRAYLGLDGSISKAIQLGFDGFNAATNANIAPQMTTGTAAGTLTVTGQVDQGSSSNKQMRLNIAMVGYSDGDVTVDNSGTKVHITYDTNTDATMQPYLQLSLAMIPTGTLTGTLDSNTNMTGVYHLTGDIKGDVTLDLMISGHLMAGTNGQTVARVPGTTTVTGTAVSGDGTYNVNVMF